MLVDIVALREFLYKFELWNRECQLEAKGARWCSGPTRLGWRFADRSWVRTLPPTLGRLHVDTTKFDHSSLRIKPR